MSLGDGHDRRRTSTPSSTVQSREGSTVNALVELVHRCQEALDDSGRVLRMLLFDYCKAFDKVDHIILLRRVSAKLHYLLPNWRVV